MARDPFPIVAGARVIARIRWPRGLDAMAGLIGLGMVLVGSVVGARSTVVDVDEVLFRSTIVHMQQGSSYYDAFAGALREKSGVGPSQVRSVRTPVVSLLLSPLPASSWRWAAGIPALALCLTSALLAGPDVLSQRFAAGLTGLWMVVSLPLLYLHAELWGAPLVLGAALLLRTRREGPSAALALLATGVRELFGVSLLVGILVRRDRRPWLVALALAGVGAAIHVRWARGILDPLGYEPPLVALDPYSRYVSPGEAGVAQVLGVAMLGAALVGWWLRRHDDAFRYLAAVALPLIVATALFGRTYWSLTWCGASSAAAAVTLAAVARRRRPPNPATKDAPNGPYPRI